MKIMIAGGTGFVGRALLSELKQKGHEVFLLTRRERKSTDAAVHYRQWDGETLGPWADEMTDMDAVINLAGEPIAAKRWTQKQKESIVHSRMNATRTLVQAMTKASRKPSVLINASAVGYYGDVPEGEVTESSLKGKGFLAETCAEWETAARGAETLGVRTVLLRIGVVLGEGGGALAKMIPPFLFFAGGPLGSGKQWFPWVHRDDVVGVILFALENKTLSGPVNTTAPNPLIMHDFCREFGKAMHRPSWAPVPAFVLKFILGEMSEMLLGGQKAIPAKLLEHGYSFKFSTAEAALRPIFA